MGNCQCWKLAWMRLMLVMIGLLARLRASPPSLPNTSTQIPSTDLATAKHQPAPNQSPNPTPYNPTTQAHPLNTHAYPCHQLDFHRADGIADVYGGGRSAELYSAGGELASLPTTPANLNTIHQTTDAHRSQTP